MSLAALRDELIADHRQIEGRLDALARSIERGDIDLESFRQAWALCREHYGKEAAFLEKIHGGAARKMARQHADALEIAAEVERAGTDRVYLARRFLAVAQHNIIEEERDIFPLAQAG